MENKEQKKSGLNNDKVKRRGSLKLFYAVCIIIVIFIATVMYRNSEKPSGINLGRLDTNVKGATFIKTNQALIEQASKNWLPNDLFWPTIFLDNIPNFQIGELEAIRYNIRVLRDNLSRTRTTDKIDPLADRAFNALSNDLRKWWMPSAESKLRLADKLLGDYYKNVLTGKSNFYPRFDNLIQLLEQYASLMGGVNTKLINASRDVRRFMIMSKDIKDIEQNRKIKNMDVPWSKIDDNFYYAEGVAYVLYESFKAIKIDFKDIIKSNNATTLVNNITNELGSCNFEPLVILNGDTDSIFANHCLNLSSIFNDARQKINSLISILKQG